MAAITQAEFNTMLQTAIAAGLPGGYYTSRWSGEELDNLAAAGNPNLLDNWYFVDPINQRGQTEYTGPGYCIDRWQISSGTSNIATVSDGEVIVTFKNAAYWSQVVDNPARLAGCTVTASALCSDVGGELKLRVRVNGTIQSGISCSSNSLAYNTYTLPSNLDSLQFELGSAGSIPEYYSVGLIAVKLELGSVQTLAHQDFDGNWVLNDPPPNKALELAKCQRYQISYEGSTILPVCGLNANYIWAIIFLPTPLRIAPALARGSVGVYGIGTAINTQIGGFIFEYFLQGNALVIRAAKAAHGLTSSSVTIQMNSVLFDANL